ncbi:MAG: diguanylate cyclase [Candidatus Gastranaerophilales bacterium]|nr:diguanylate cyclase [Candidatus Gastranaerophilales bacterium]
MDKKILVIDDSKTQLLTTKMKLEKNGFEVVCAENGMDGMKKVYETCPDLVLSDIIMPNINGYHLCRLLKQDEKTSHIPIILLTVLDKKIDRFWGIRAGADGFFNKDGNSEELIQKIYDLLEKAEEDKRFSPACQIMDDYDFNTKITEILDESLVESTLINEFRDLAEFVLEEKIFNNRLFELLSSILDYNLAGVFYNDSDKKDKVIYFSQNECEVSSDIISQTRDLIHTHITDRNLAYSQYKLDYKILESSANIKSFRQNIDDMNQFKSELIIPIENEGKLIGALALFHVLPNKYNNSKILHIVLSELKMVLKIRWLYSETKLLSIIDPLTTLYNRRYFQQVLEKEFSRSNRYASPLSIAMVDIDNFKKLNDSYGHLFGDEILQTISKLFLDSFRKTDYVARYGGEELVAVLPETTLEQAIIPFERLRNKIQNYAFVYDEKRINVTVSIGIAQNNFDMLTTDNFIKQADEALYIAKEKGKNRIELAFSG